MLIESWVEKAGERQEFVLAAPKLWKTLQSFRTEHETNENRRQKNPTLRLAIGDRENRRSNLWRVAARKSDVYVNSGGGAPVKLSFHESGICRDAFTGEFGVPRGMQDRVMTRWRRAEIPPPDTGKACSVLEIVIPNDFLSTGLSVPAKEICWIDAAAISRSKCIELFFSADGPEVAEPLIQQGQRTPIAGIRLENSDAELLAKAAEVGLDSNAARTWLAAHRNGSGGNHT